jgi:uncharacterized protein YceH (UPF0502 family)
MFDFAALTPEEIRALGALIEKSIATPDYYPLTLNALVNACNQLTNREPIVSYDESTVTRALESLREKRLATIYHGADSRVARHKHTFTDAFLLTPAELALLCVLMLRGPQTAGELRTRAERLFVFDSLAEVEESLNALAARTPEPLVTKLPRQPGTKESRYTHLLSGPPAAPVAGAADPGPPTQPASTSSASPGERDRLTRLEEESAELRRELAELRQQFSEFKKQFE